LNAPPHRAELGGSAQASRDGVTPVGRSADIAGARSDRPCSYLHLMAADRTTVRAEGWNHHIARQIAPRWPAICRSWFRDDADESADWTWKFFQYVFPLADPRGTVALADPTFSNDEKAAIDRYLAHARDLAATTVLTAPNGFSVYMPKMDSEPEISETTSARDATVGFLTMFRQFHTPEELASFTRISGLLTREMRLEGRELESLKAWRRAHATLRQTHLDHLILVQAAADGHVPQHLSERNASHPSSIDSPQLMINTVFYGDAIHWGDQRSVIEAWNRDHAVMAAKRRFDALRCAVHLGHLYVGFGGVVGLATRRLSLQDI
jgi:hypothetical protein